MIRGRVFKQFYGALALFLLVLLVLAGGATAVFAGHGYDSKNNRKADFEWFPVTNTGAPIKPYGESQLHNRFLFESPFVVVDTVTQERYETTASFEEIFISNDGIFGDNRSLPSEGQVWYWNYKNHDVNSGITSSSRYCPGAILVNINHSSTPDHIFSIGLMQPVREGGDCVINFAGGRNEVIKDTPSITGKEESNKKIVLAEYVFSFSPPEGDFFDNFFSTYFWNPEGKLTSFINNEQFTKLAPSSAQYKWIKDNHVNNLDEFDAYTTKEGVNTHYCTGSEREVKAWLLVKHSPDKLNELKYLSTAAIWSGSELGWHGKRTRCLHNGYQFSPHFGINSGFITSGDLPLAYPKNADSDTTNDEKEIPQQGSSDTTEDRPSCESEAGALGWIMCKVFEALVDGTRTLFENFIEPLLVFSPLELVTTPSDSIDVNRDDVTQSEVLFKTWSSFRSVGNIIFVVVFLLIIFAEAVIPNVDAYTIKRTLPRLVLAVILAQFSYYLASFLIDVFNVLGMGVKGLIMSPFEGNTGFTLVFDQTIFNKSASLVAVGALVFAGVPIMTGALFALLATVLTLAIRQAFIMLMIVISPLALAMWVLPNTERLAKSWMSNFMKALAMFPFIMGLISIGDFMGRLFSTATKSTAMNAEVYLNPVSTLASIDNRLVSLSQFATNHEGVTEGAYQLIAMILTVAPYFLIPMTFKFAGSALGAIGSFSARANSMGKGLGSGAQKWGGGKAKGYTQKTAAGNTRLGRTRVGRGVGMAASGGVTSKRREKIRRRGTMSALQDLKDLGWDNDAETNELLGMSHSQVKGMANSAVSNGKMSQPQADALIARSSELNKYRTPATQRAARLVAANAGKVKSEHYVGATSTGSVVQKRAEVSTLNQAAQKSGKWDLSSHFVDDNGALHGGVQYDADGNVTDTGHLQTLLTTTLSGSDVSRTHRSSSKAVIHALDANMGKGGTDRDKAVRQIAHALTDDDAHDHVITAIQDAGLHNDADVQARINEIRKDRGG